MLPFYVLGNLHCLGMCGPLAMTLGTHRYRHAYFFGRLAAFTLAGALAGELGAVLNVIFRTYHLSAATSLLFGFGMLFAGFWGLIGRSFPGQARVTQLLAKASKPLALLMLRDQPLATFLFGFLTIALPCGQSLVVFSACALSGSFLIGMLNGFAFALLTTPSLVLAMHAHSWLKKAGRYTHLISSSTLLAVGAIAACRGLAELNVLPHIVFAWPFDPTIHLVLF